MDCAEDGIQPQAEHIEARLPKRKRGRQKVPHSCQFCGADLEAGGRYHKRYRICPEHMMASCLEVDGCPQRFCQQCGRFHMLAEFEGDKRSCRDQLGKQALRRRLARRAAAGQAPKQSDSPSGCGSGSSGAERTGGHVTLERAVQAQQLFAAVEARAEAAAAAPVPPPWLASLLPQSQTAVEQLAALLVQQQQTQQAQQAQQQQAQQQQAQQAQQQQAQQQQQQQAQQAQQAQQQQQQQQAQQQQQQQQPPLLLPPPPPQQQRQQPLFLDLVRQPLFDVGQLLPAQALPSQQQLLQAYGSDHSSHSMLALARAASAGTAAALPSPLAPITPPSAEDEAAPQLQQAAVTLLPALSHPSLAPLLQAVMAFAPAAAQPQQPLARQHLLPLPPLPPQLPLQPQLHLPAQLPAPGPFAQQLMQHLLAANQQRQVAQQRAQRSEDELAALLRAIAHFLTALCGAAQGPQPAEA